MMHGRSRRSLERDRVVSRTSMACSSRKVSGHSLGWLDALCNGGARQRRSASLVVGSTSAEVDAVMIMRDECFSSVHPRLRVGAWVHVHDPAREEMLSASSTLMLG